MGRHTHLLFRSNAFKNGVHAPCLSEHCTKRQSKTNGHDPGASLQRKNSKRKNEVDQNFIMQNENCKKGSVLIDHLTVV